MSTEGLPIRSIQIHSSDLHEVQQDTWNNIFKPAKLIYGGKVYPVKIGIRGGHTRNYEKKSYDIKMEGGRTLHWNAEYDDPSMIRNALSFHFFNQIGVPSPRTNHIWLIINGEPQGVYLEIESVDRYFFAKRGIGYTSLLYAVNDSADFGVIDPETKAKKRSLLDGYEVIRGPKGTRTRLASFVKNLNRLSGKDLAVHTARRLDVDQYLLWLAGAVLTGNYDGFDQNYAIYEHKDTGKYRIIPWDYEGTWGRNCYGKPCGSDLVQVQGYNRLTAKLFSFPSIRKKYSELLQKLLEKSFTIDRIDPIISALYKKLSPAIHADHTRKHSYETFQSEPSFIRNYIRERRAIVRRELRKWS
ncbi:CotH kinase family protein [Paenibacillus protaetiae]|uniref:Spore coat protein CotH n=1 Tax=Paenibacillus protaetiae TaxID=2509456 RepID=A0A4P6EWQ1_9BACL|nr:CotH kinase family protein [Paenibacillus protaetiae]QAY66633.1 spore coat protein CotH [Paenibacillus protaetiae]